MNRDNKVCGNALGEPTQYDVLAQLEHVVHMAMIRAGMHAARSAAPAKRGRIYIAGPCTGVPDANRPAFAAAELALRNAGFEPVNPSTLPGHAGHDQSWESFMRVDIPELCSCAAVALLTGWEHSRGACVEADLAKVLRIDVRPLADWLRRPDLSAIYQGKA